MKLKPLEWKQIQGENLAIRCNAFTDIGGELEFGRHPKHKTGYWNVSLDSLHATGRCESIEDGKRLAEAAYLEMLLDQLEIEHEVMAAPRTGLDRDRGDTWGSD